MKCQNCGTELPKYATYCDVCGAYCGTYDERKDDKNRKILIVAAILAISIVALIVKNVMEKDLGEVKPELYDLTTDEVIVSEENLSKIKCGMTYEEFCDVVGDEEAKNKWDPEEAKKYKYVWYGMGSYDDRKNAPEANIKAEFYYKDATLQWYSATNILKEADIVECYKTILDDPSKLDAPLVTRKQVKKVYDYMTYAEVSELFGGDGVISGTYFDSNEEENDLDDDIKQEEDEYRVSYVWRCMRKTLTHKYPSFIEIEFVKGGYLDDAVVINSLHINEDGLL